MLATLTALRKKIEENVKHEDYREGLILRCQVLYQRAHKLPAACSDTTQTSLERDLDVLTREVDAKIQSRQIAPQHALADDLRSYFSLLRSPELSMIAHQESAELSRMQGILDAELPVLRKRVRDQRVAVQTELLANIANGDYVKIRQRSKSERFVLTGKVVARNADDEIADVRFWSSETEQWQTRRLWPFLVLVERSRIDCRSKKQEWIHQECKAEDVWVLSADVDGEEYAAAVHKHKTGERV